MKRVKGGLWMIATLLFSLSGCADFSSYAGGRYLVRSSGGSPDHHRAFVMPRLPVEGEGMRGLLRFAQGLAGLPETREAAICRQAIRNLKVNPGDYARLTLGMVALMAPGCLEPGAMKKMLRPIESQQDGHYAGLAAVLGQVASQREQSAHSRAALQTETTKLRAKLKALTRIETQVNQVKNRELQNFN